MLADMQLLLLQHRQVHSQLGFSGLKSDNLKFSIYSILGHVNFALISPSF